MNTPLELDLVVLSEMEETLLEENDAFRSFLKQQDGQVIDPLVHALNAEISASIDCTSCGNCCRSLMINVEPGEPEALSGYLDMPVRELKERFIEESQQGRMIVNSIPCHFLENNRCSVYEFRFSECREFPHLHKTGFIQRFSGTLLHFGRCPIIYNVVQSLKSVLNFENTKAEA